jgi:hypothetical protein
VNPIDYRLATGRRPHSAAWEVAVRGLYGLPLDLGQTELFRKITGGREPRDGVGFEEAFFNVGRAGGKDDTLSTLINYECRFGGHEVAAAPGQRIPAQVVCPLKNQAVGTLRMVKGEANSAFNRKHIARETTDAIEWSNGTSAQVQTADDTAVVGDTLAMLLLNEWALIPNAKEIEANARPALRRMKGAPVKRFVRISSSYLKDGPAWECYRDHFGRDDSDVLVVQGSTELFNPNVDPAWLAKQRKALGELLAGMHFDCVWADTIAEAWFHGDTIARAVQTGHARLPHVRDAKIIIAADAAFSATGDKFGWAVASSRAGAYDYEINARGPRRTVLHDCGAWRADRPPREMAMRLRDEVCRRYGTDQIIIDQHADHAFAQLCRDVGLRPTIIHWRGGESGTPLAIEHERPEDRQLSKSDRYRSVRTAMADGSLVVPDNADLLADLRACRGTMLPGGGERIEVPRTTRGHGDVLSAAVMALSQAMIGPARVPYSEKTPWEVYNRQHLWEIRFEGKPPMRPFRLDTSQRDLAEMLRIAEPSWTATTASNVAALLNSTSAEISVFEAAPINRDPKRRAELRALFMSESTRAEALEAIKKELLPQ